MSRQVVSFPPPPPSSPPVTPPATDPLSDTEEILCVRSSLRSSHLAADPASGGQAVLSRRLLAGGRRGRIRSSSVSLPAPRRSAPSQGAAPRRCPSGPPPPPGHLLRPVPLCRLRVIHPLPRAVTLAAIGPRSPQPSRQPLEVTPTPAACPRRSPLTRGQSLPRRVRFGLKVRRPPLAPPAFTAPPRRFAHGWGAR